MTKSIVNCWRASLANDSGGRKMLMGCLFAGSAAMVVTAFLTMRPAEKLRAGS